MFDKPQLLEKSEPRDAVSKPKAEVAGGSAGLCQTLWTSLVAFHNDTRTVPR